MADVPPGASSCWSTALRSAALQRLGEVQPAHAGLAGDAANATASDAHSHPQRLEQRVGEEQQAFQQGAEETMGAEGFDDNAAALQQALLLPSQEPVSPLPGPDPAQAFWGTLLPDPTQALRGAGNDRRPTRRRRDHSP